MSDDAGTDPRRAGAGSAGIAPADLARLLPLLPVLDAVGATTHVTAAAELLGQPQSTVSRALARASAVVGVDLVIRHGRGIRLTAAAEMLLPFIRSALAQVGDGVDLVRSRAGVAAGQIRIAFQNTFGEATLPVLIEYFQRHNQDARFELVQGARDFCLTALDKEEMDLALVSPVPAATPQAPSQILYREPLRLVVPGGHRLAGRRQVRLDEVRAEDFVLLGHGFGLRSIADELCAAAGFRPRIRFEGQDAHTLRGLVSAGLGVSILPPSGADHLTPASGPLDWQELTISSPSAFRHIGLVWGANQHESSAAARFRAMVLARSPELLAGMFPAR